MISLSLSLGVYTYCIALNRRSQTGVNPLQTNCGLTFSGRVVLLAGILTIIVVISLTLYVFWAAKNGCDFHVLGPFLFTSLLVLIAFALIQVCGTVFSLFQGNSIVFHHTMNVYVTRK
ncbi:protein LIFEGUARD 4-like [Rhododendron vialii]|uniref:protein LIFEGUARD 4-like n=1 Tax=Rhododendron vialii TaxID=182163 RepID=UPI00265FA8DD|nr:protein LIFEGUARD 4-like [Rhododendron vialii]